MRKRYAVTVMTLWTVLGLSSSPAIGQEAATQERQPSSEMIWETVAGGEDEEDEVLLRVVGPNGFVLEKRGLRGQTLSLKAVDAQGSVLPDGAYKYELRTLPRVEKAGLEALVQAGHTAQILEIKRLAQELMRVETGAFFIEGGAIAMPENEVAE